jgi:hypothetical protein
MITDEQIAKLKEANPGVELSVLHLEDLDLDVVVKTPDEGVWKRFRSQASDDAQKSGALRGLVFGCAVWPSDFATLVSRRPGIVETVGNRLVEIAGVSMAVTVRKL